MKNNIQQISRFIKELKKRTEIASQGAYDLKLDGKPFNGSDYFGAYQAYYTITGKVTIPKEWQSAYIEVEIDDVTDGDNGSNPQFKLFLDGKLVATFDANHHRYKMDARGEQTFELEIFTGNSSKKFPVFIRVYENNDLVQKLVYDFDVLHQSLSVMDFDSLDYLDIHRGVIDAMRCIDTDAQYDQFMTQLEEASHILDTLYNKHSNTATLHALGHTHIDIAWLWTVRQAIEKGERSFTTVLNLMDSYPEFLFLQSQPQLYEFIEQKNPLLFERIKEAVARGQWEVEGGMWVEADTVLTSGESLVRQFLYGKSYFKETFGVDSKILWLPDVFGYSASLPQIMKKSGIDYFMTTKLSWNQYNAIPYDSFFWKGIDGSEVLTHFITTPGTTYQPRPWYTTYNGLLEVAPMKGSWHRYQQKELNSDMLVAFGYGDGGGGPTEEMIETGLRMSKGIPSLPKLKFNTAGSFFKQLADNLGDKDVPRWNGELYFEYHRGTYTSRAVNKKYNRMIENSLQSLEKLALLTETSIVGKDTMWKKLLLNQFHDILPGTSIKEVYDDSNEDYLLVLGDIANNMDTMFGVGDNYVLFNPLSIKRGGLVRGDKGQIIDGAITQVDAYGQRINYVEGVSPLSVTKYKMHEAKIEKFVSSRVPQTLNTPFYTVVFNEAYEIVGLYDKVNDRECILPGGKFNELLLYEDLPMDYDAWDIDEYYAYKNWLIDDVVKASIIADGPIRKTIEVERNISNSIIKQHIHFYEKSELIEFETWVTWQENGKLLKTNFDVNINANSAFFDIPFGVVERTVHNNTSWDRAQFEVNGQKWADMSEGNYGFTLINDSKYGYHAKGNRFGLSLLRSSNEPFIHADHGSHYFKYALMPHAGSWKDAQIMSKAYAFNNPIIAKNNVALEDIDLGIHYISDSVYLDTVKQAESDDGIILRFYEYTNSRCTLPLKFKRELDRVYICNLLEENETELNHNNFEVKIPFNPFEIVSLRVIYKK